MNSIFLDKIILEFPKQMNQIATMLLRLLEPVGMTENGVFKFRISQPNYHPDIYLDLHTKGKQVNCNFVLLNHVKLCIHILNETGVEKQNPLPYNHLTIQEFTNRFEKLNLKILDIDHIGFNLPWFSSEIHPKISMLREILSDKSLYHTFPTGEPWDFILPGEKEEIFRLKEVDYTKIRKPKFEIVSFANCSTPLIQFDVGVNTSYEKLRQIFPEGLDDKNLKNIWIYFKKDAGIDLCFVLNEYNEKDWSDFFQNSRIVTTDE